MLKQNETTESGHQLEKISVTPVNDIGLCQMAIFHVIFFFQSPILLLYHKSCFKKKKKKIQAARFCKFSSLLTE